MSTASNALRALEQLESVVDLAEVTKLHETLRAAIPRGTDMAVGFFAFAELVAELVSQDDAPRVRETMSWAFSVAVAERMDHDAECWHP